MRKTAIPPPPMSSDSYLTLQALKTSVEALTGQTGRRINKLGTEAQLSDVIVKLNEIIDRLQS